MAELDGPRWGPASKATPKHLVVLCHGLGADGHDLIDLAPTWAHALPDALFVSVDAPFPHESGFGRQWWSVEDRTPAVMDAGVRRAAGFLNAFIDAELDRLALPAEAYALMQEMRLHLSSTRHARAQVSTLREHFLKLGAQVIVTVRRIVLHLPQAFPYRESFHRLALSLGAQSG